MLQEYLVKGLALGLLFMVGLAADWRTSLLTLGGGVLGLVLTLVVIQQRTRRRGAPGRPWRSSILVFQMMENPAPIFLGLITGLLAGAFLASGLGYWSWMAFLTALGVGLLVAVAMTAMRLVEHRLVRQGLIFLLVGGLIWFVMGWLTRDDLASLHKWLGYHLLTAVVLLYFLTFIGRTEETELEMGLACVLLGLALWSLLPAGGPLLALAVPLLIYLLYTQFLLRGMQSFKAEMHGLAAARQGATLQAMTALQRALQLSPQNQSARQTLWRVHRQIDLHQVHQDERLLKLIDFGMCLQRARELLFADQVTSNVIEEAKQLLTLVADQRPERMPEVLYYRAVAHTHAGEFDKAEGDLLQLLDAGQFGPEQQESRRRVLLPAWQLALLQHRELSRRVGERLFHEGRRMDAIAVVEESARQKPLEEAGLELKKVLYAGITQAEYDREAGAAPLQQASQFDHKYLYEQGLELLDDPARWQQGAAWLRIAARGQPRHAPAVLKLISQAAAKHGDTLEEARALAEVKTWANVVGQKDLSPESKTAYFSTIRRLGEAAYREGRTSEALENLLLCIEDPSSGADTLRMVAELYEQRGEVLNTFWYNEQCLLYDAKNSTYQERRDRVYISLTPEQIKSHLDKLEKILDQNYLIGKAKELLEFKNAGSDQLQWAQHLAELLLAAAPERIAGWVLLGRSQLRLGRTEAALSALEKAHQLGKAKKPGGEDLEAWYLACRILGDYYLQQERFAEALECFTDYQQSTKSGAETLYKLGQVAERLGQPAKAKKYYQHANMFDHPNKYEVSMALERLAQPG
jgi:tetratricopeptide (TPR) repeat protein